MSGNGNIRALRIEMCLGSFGACVWIKGTMAELVHVDRFADRHCAKTAHSRDHHGRSARLALKLKGTRAVVNLCRFTAQVDPPAFECRVLGDANLAGKECGRNGVNAPACVVSQ